MVLETFRYVDDFVVFTRNRDATRMAVDVLKVLRERALGLKFMFCFRSIRCTRRKRCFWMPHSRVTETHAFIRFYLMFWPIFLFCFHHTR